MTAAADLAGAAAREWDVLVTAAVVGTDRRAPSPAEAGWQSWAGDSDPAVAVLDRAAAVVVARRAGARPLLAPHSSAPAAPADARPPCPAPCAARLGRILAGEHDLLLPEWLARCEELGVQLPWATLPALLLRGRRHPELDQVVRRLAAGRAAWLAEMVPELGVRAHPPAAPAPPARQQQPTTSTDGGAVVAALAQIFADGQAGWAASPQLRLTAAALDPAWLPALVVELSRLAFHAATERTRADLLALVEFRLAMLREFGTGASDSSPPRGTADPR